MRFRTSMAFTFSDAQGLHKLHINPDSFNFARYRHKNKINNTYIKATFKQNIWITIPLFHKLKFPRWLYYFNSVVAIFTGVEGILTAKKEDEK